MPETDPYVRRPMVTIDSHQQPVCALERTVLMVCRPGIDPPPGFITLTVTTRDPTLLSYQRFQRPPKRDHCSCGE